MLTVLRAAVVEGESSLSRHILRPCFLNSKLKPEKGHLIQVPLLFCYVVPA